MTVVESRQYTEISTPYGCFCKLVTFVYDFGASKLMRKISEIIESIMQFMMNCFLNQLETIYAVLVTSSKPALIKLRFSSLLRVLTVVIDNLFLKVIRMYFLESTKEIEVGNRTLFAIK